MSQISMQVPPMTKINKVIIIAHAGTFILSQVLQQLAGVSLLSILGLSSIGLQQGLYFQPFTYFLVEQSFMAMLFNCLLIWFIGAELEQKWGRKVYLQFLGVALFAGSIAFVLFANLATGMNVSLYGIGGIVLSLLLAYGFVYSERVLSFMLIFPMKAKYFCALIAGIELYMAIFSPMAKAAWCHLVAMAASFCFLKYKSLAAQGWSLTRIKHEYQLEKQKKRLKLVKDDDEESDDKKPKYWH